MSATIERAHHRRRFSGRDPHEEHRAATPLELLYDLTIVVAFGTASNEISRTSRSTSGPESGASHSPPFAVSWAWVNYSWFASAYDSDDWVFRLAARSEAALALEGEAEIGPTGTVLTVVIPLACFALVFCGVYSTLMRTMDPLHLTLLALTAAVLVLAVILASAGVNVTVCLLPIALAPVATVVGYETIGHRHSTEALERL